MKNLLLLFILTICIMACQKTEQLENIVVIGGGLIGSSTAWELSKYGEEVLLIEQQDSIYTFGSSFGEARISRSMGPKNDLFSYLQQTSVREVKGLVDYLNNNTTVQTHKMEDVYTTTPVTYIYDKAQLKEGSLTYGLIAANLLLNKKDSSFKYEKSIKAFGTDRLLKDLTGLVTSEK